MFGFSIDKDKLMFYNFPRENKKTHLNHTNGAATPLIKDRSSYEKIQIQRLKRPEFEAQNCT